MTLGASLVLCEDHANFAFSIQVIELIDLFPIADRIPVPIPRRPPWPLRYSQLPELSYFRIFSAARVSLSAIFRF
jgi:hypothetical protein